MQIVTSRFKDYLENRALANELVARLIAYYHKRGYTKVRVWIEPELTASGKSFYNIRSNISFKVP